jgi:hypothetical protein
MEGRAHALLSHRRFDVLSEAARLQAMETKGQGTAQLLLASSQTALKPADYLRYHKTRLPCSLQALLHC